VIFSCPVSSFIFLQELLSGSTGEFLLLGTIVEVVY
jgi:hypothetical protein